MRRRASAGFFLRKFAASMLPVFVALAILGTVSIYITNNFVNREILTVTTKQLDALKEALDLSVFDMDSLNLAFSSNTTIVSALDSLLGKSSLTWPDVDRARLVGDILNDQINARPYVVSVYVYLDKYPNRFFASDMGIVTTKEFTDTSWIKSYSALPKSRLLWTQVRTITLPPFEQSPRTVLTMFRRLSPTVTGLSGVIVMNMKKDYFDTLVARAKLNPGQEIDLIGQQGNLILTTNPSGRLSPMARSVSGAQIDTLTERTLAGQRDYVYSTTTGRYGWRLITVIPAARVNRVPRTIQRLILILFAISLVLGALLTYSLVRANTRRVQTVMNLFRKADRGEEITETPDPRNDEFDLMIEALVRTFLRERFAALQLSERQARAEILELRALRAQINPHFLFNTLDSLYWMVYGTNGVPSTAATVVKDLSSLLRYSLEDTEQVVLGDEVEHSKRYVAIQQYRYPGKFGVSWNIDPATLDCQVIKLFLQPLIENSIYHGIREASGSRTIEVESSIHMQNDRRVLRVVVEDDGEGMAPDRLSAVVDSLERQEHPGEHIGIYNTHRRVQLMFGHSYGMSISSSQATGTRVEITFPA